MDTGFLYIVRKLYGPSASLHSILKESPDDPRALRLLVLHPPSKTDRELSELLEASLSIDTLDSNSIHTAISSTWCFHIPSSVSAASEKSSVSDSYQGKPPAYNILLLVGTCLHDKDESRFSVIASSSTRSSAGSLGRRAFHLTEEIGRTLGAGAGHI